MPRLAIIGGIGDVLIKDETQKREDDPREEKEGDAMNEPTGNRLGFGYPNRREKTVCVY